MKKIISLILTLALLLPCFGSMAETVEPQRSKTLVVYFSWSGNTAEMAETIAQATEADVFVLEPETPYPEEYTACTEVAKQEKEDNVRPALKALPEALSDYDTIYLGFPIWWHTAPMLIGTFLENADFTGVDIYPFTQSASMNTEHFDEAMTFLRSCDCNGIIHDGLFAQADDTTAINEYLSTIGKE